MSRRAAPAVIGPTVLPVHQPAYLPWPGYFSRLLAADRFVVLDHVQYKGGFQHRNFIGRDIRHVLTVPVRHDFGQKIHQVTPAGDAWRARHWRALTHTYGKAPHWRRWEDRLGEVYARPWERLTPLNIALFELLLDAFGIELELIYSSQIKPEGAKTTMLVDLCNRLGADTLLLGEGAHDYLDEQVLDRAHVGVQIASYIHPPYPRGRWPFLSGLSALDLLMHCGPQARDVLRRGARIRPYATGSLV